MKKMRIPITLGCCLVLFLLGLVCVTQVYYSIFSIDKILLGTYFIISMRKPQFKRMFNDKSKSDLDQGFLNFSSDCLPL